MKCPKLESTTTSWTLPPHRPWWRHQLPWRSLCPVILRPLRIPSWMIRGVICFFLFKGGWILIASLMKKSDFSYKRNKDVFPKNHHLVKTKSLLVYHGSTTLALFVAIPDLDFFGPPVPYFSLNQIRIQQVLRM